VSKPNTSQMAHAAPKIVAIIPARYGSTRFPGKPLADLAGKPMIQHVYERVSLARRVDEVLIATDDERIQSAVEGFGGTAVMTGQHPSGTDRVAEVASELRADIVVNVQGDEPLIDPAMVDELIAPLLNDPALPMATLAARLTDEEELRSPGVVKVVRDRRGRALYFSRSLIPYPRDAEVAAHLYRKHIGIYAYRRDFLLDLAARGPSPLERAEGLEQLRALESVDWIQVLDTDYDSVGIDTPEDLEMARRALARQS
jgi:3-deoxy-manno-octulosonate cytidylyltransferase (CMP-KDO synthetase)